MKLFKYEGYRITIDPEAMLIKPFRIIWERDVSPSKETALNELGYLYFFCDPRSDYQYITDEDERRKAIIEGEGMPSKWKPDKKMNEAIEYYRKFKSTSALLLEDTRIAVDKLRTLLRNIDLEQADSNGKPVHTLNTITSTIKQVPQLVKDLNEAEESINKEMKDTGKMRGQGEKTIFEDDLTI